MTQKVKTDIEYSYQLEEIKVDPLDKGQPLGFFTKEYLATKSRPLQKGSTKKHLQKTDIERILYSL